MIFSGLQTSFWNALFANEFPWKLSTAIPSGIVLKIYSIRFFYYIFVNNWNSYWLKLVVVLKWLLIFNSNASEIKGHGVHTEENVEKSTDILNPWIYWSVKP